MKNTSVLFLCVGCIIGWGAFILPQDLFLSKAGLLESIIGLGLVGVAICIIAAQYTYLLQRYKRSGGEFYFTLKVLGRTHGFICGWFISLAYLCIIPLNATALNVMSHSFGFSGDIVLYHINGNAIYLLDIVISMSSIVCIGILNILGIRAAFLLQKIFTLLLCGSVVLFFVIMGIDSASYENFLSYFYQKEISLYGVMAVFALAPWAYLGFDCGVQIIQAITYRKGIFNFFIYLSIWIGFALYAMLICITAFGVARDEIINLGWATHASIEGYFSIFGSIVLCIGVLSALFSGINGFFITTSKIFERLSITCFIPATLIKQNRFNVSYRVVYVIGFISCVMVIFGRESLLYIVDMSCVGIIVGFLYVSIISLLLKQRERQRISISSLLALGLSIIFGLLIFVPFSPAALKLPSIIALAIWVLAGILLFARARRNASI